MNKISVIIGTYNYGRYIEEAVDSVLKQDFPLKDLELIVVDDGSTDDTRERLQKYGHALKYIYQENAGQGAAFNAGFKAATGELICLLDADDAWKPEKLRLTTEAFAEAGDIGMVQHFMLDVNPQGATLTQQFEERLKYYTLQDLLAGRTGFTGTSGLAFRRVFLDKVLPVPAGLFYCADEYLYLGILFYSRVRSINSVLGFKKIHGDNWFAGTMNDTNRLKNYVKVKTLILSGLKARLKGIGVELKDTDIPLQMELTKAKVLFHSRKGERKRALKIISDEILFNPAAKRRLFNAATLAISALSPALYLKLHAFYTRLRAPARPPGDGPA
jgi:glycosyltransferase involved in cell wall biosynthesis